METRTEYRGRGNGMVLGGSALALAAMRSHGLLRVPLALAGIAIAYGGMRRRKAGLPAMVSTHAAVTIHRSAAELYARWRDFPRLPDFMRHLRAVEVVGDNRYRWVAEVPGIGIPIEWLAEVTYDQPDRTIRWRSLPESAVKTEGEVTFAPAPGDRGTEVHLAISYDAPGLPASAANALLRRVSAQVAQDELRGFKELMEAGEVPTTEGQPFA